MPTLVYHRIWCKKCKDFTLHTGEFLEDNKNCKICGTLHVKTLLSEIPKDKILEQRKRYNEKEKNFNPFSIFLGGFGVASSMFSPVGSDVEVRESDAGQRAIDDIKRKERNKKYNELRLKREKLEEEAKKYEHLGRNSICVCGSGIKYKKCCLDKFRDV